MISITLTNDVKLLTKLKRLANKDMKAAVRKSSRRAAKPVLAKARELAPKKTGLLARSIKVVAIKRSRKRFGVRVTTGIRGNAFAGKAFYGAFQDLGWKTGKRGSENRRQVEPKHFMRRAVEATESQVKSIFAAELRKEITAAAKR